MQERRRKILIIDDEPSICQSLSLILRANFDVSSAVDGEEALGMCELELPDLILLDMKIPKMDGIEVMRRLKERASNVPIIVLTGGSTVKNIVHAIKNGAHDFINKPFDIEELKASISVILDGPPQVVEDEKVPVPSRRAFNITADFGPMVGRSSSMAAVFAMVEQIARRESTVLISGESGTGKELIARQLHERSPRRNGPFVAINCAAIPESLIESELFGHEKGAFTHAIERRLGQFELADHGTLFLDEIGELSLAVQVKLLRFLQEQEFYRVGRAKPIQINVRVITATNKHLEDLIKAKTFRQDLFYRINVINIALPPLRDRVDDILGLTAHFIEKLSRAYGGRILTFSEEARVGLSSYAWPGNVRELENVVESLLALCPQDHVELAHLPNRLKNHSTVEVPTLTGGAAPSLGFEEAERLFETEMILRALKRANFVQTRAAEMLGITRRILKYKMDKLCITDKGEVLNPGARHEN